MSTKKSHCNECERETNHSVLFAKDESGYDEQAEVHWSNSNFVLSCLGCDHISFRQEHTNSENWNPETGEQHLSVRIFPKNPKVRARPSWFAHIYEFDTKLRLDQMLPQIYDAFDNGAYWISIMGVRAVIENVMISKVGDQGSFGKNLSAFSQQGHITDSHRLALTAAIDQGSAAIHKGKVTKKDTALSAIQVAENVLESIFVVPLHEVALKK